MVYRACRDFNDHYEPNLNAGYIPLLPELFYSDQHSVTQNNWQAVWVLSTGQGGQLEC